jgi:hypothetical protein
VVCAGVGAAILAYGLVLVTQGNTEKNAEVLVLLGAFVTFAGIPLVAFGIFAPLYDVRMPQQQRAQSADPNLDKLAKGVFGAYLARIPNVKVLDIFASHEVPKTTYPGVDESRDRLHRAGWSVGEIVVGNRWMVSGNCGERVILAEGVGQAEAWWRACEQAMAMGLLAPPRGEDDDATPHR